MSADSRTRLPARRDLTEPSRALPSRSEHKEQLEARIEQQRIDILVESERWRHASASLEAGWRHAGRYRGLLFLAGGVLLVGGVRHPASVIRLARHLATGALLLNRSRRMLTRLR
jgi:hypothetical protein